MAHHIKARRPNGRRAFLIGVNMETVALSTAAFCLWGIRPDEKLNIAASLGFKEIEVALSTERMVRDFLRFLETEPSVAAFERISVHGPWHQARYGRNAFTEKILCGLKRIGERIPVAEYVFHAECVEGAEVLEAWGLPVCLENACTPEGEEHLASLLRRHDFTLALNMNRATRGCHDVQRLVQEFRGRITRVPVSGFTGQLGRVPLLESGQLHLLEGLQSVRAPRVLEGLFQPGDQGAIERERWAVKRAVYAARHNGPYLGFAAGEAENVV